MLEGEAADHNTMVSSSGESLAQSSYSATPSHSATSNVGEHLMDEDSHDSSSSSSSSYCSTCDGSSSDDELISPSESRSSSKFVSPVASSSDLCQIVVQISPQKSSPNKTDGHEESPEGEPVFKKPRTVSFDDVYAAAEDNEESNDTPLQQQTEIEDPLDNLNGESVNDEQNERQNDIEIINDKNDEDG